MSILIISDKDFREEKVERFVSRLTETYEEVKRQDVGNNDLANCVGCFGK